MKSNHEDAKRLAYVFKDGTKPWSTLAISYLDLSRVNAEQEKLIKALWDEANAFRWLEEQYARSPMGMVIIGSKSLRAWIEEVKKNEC
jgi:hypothetical protein